MLDNFTHDTLHLQELANSFVSQKGTYMVILMNPKLRLQLNHLTQPTDLPSAAGT